MRINPSIKFNFIDKNMKIEVSDGELVDKYSILCLKLDLIHNETKREKVQHEKELLHDDATVLVQTWPMYYRLLFHVNKQIWDKTDEMKALDWSDNPGKFARLAQEIFCLNDQRFRLKRIFNTASHVQEQKSYANKVLHLSTTNSETLKRKLSELVSMVLRYDEIHIHGITPPSCLRDRQMFQPLILFFHQEENTNIPSMETLSCPDPEVVSIIDHFTNTQA